MFQKKLVQEIKTHIIDKYFSKIMQFMKQCEKKFRFGQATAHNTAHCMLENQGYIHSQYVILIAFPLQKWLHERPSILHYTYIAGLFHSVTCKV